MEIKTLLITQARTGSSRLPGKVLKTVEGKTLLEIHLNRLKKCKNVSEILVATTTEGQDKKICDLAENLGFRYFRSSEEDVLDRFYQAAKPLNPEWVVRVTSDCPLLDPELVDKVISYAQEQKKDYVSNGIEECFPDGQDVEVFTFTALEKAWKEAQKSSEREHVTPYIRKNSDIMGGELFSAEGYPCEEDFSGIRMTVDEPSDFEMIKKFIRELGTDKSWKEYTDYMIENGLTEINKGITRNEGYLKSIEGEQ